MRRRSWLILLCSCTWLLATFARGSTIAGTSVNGIYDIPDGPNTPSVAALSNPDVDGLYIHVGWNRVEKTEGTFDWSSVDKLLNTAVSYGKKVELDLSVGRNSPAWVYTDGAQSFSWIWNQNWGQPLCSTAIAPVPWDPIYKSKFKAAVLAMGQHYATNPSVAMVKLTGINGPTDEDQLPRSTGQPIYDSSNQLVCYSNDDVSNWLAIGYTTTLITSAFSDLYGVWSSAFPSTGISAMLVPKGFPLDTGSIAPSIFAKVGIKSNFYVQNNGWSSSWVMTSGGFGLSGDQEVATQSTLFLAAIALALAQSPPPKFLEIYESDIVNSANADTIHEAHQAVLLN